MRKLTRTEIKFLAIFWIVATVVFIVAGRLAGQQRTIVDLVVGVFLVLGAIFVHRVMLKRQNRRNR